MILSMSKRIMNEVICTAEDNDIEIFYQDTDSMHLYEKEIPKLQKIYNAKYGRELIGTDLGQFHSDFEMSGSVGEVSSLLTVMLGKKCYLDVLKDDSDQVGCHILGNLAFPSFSKIHKFHNMTHKVQEDCHPI